MKKILLNGVSGNLGRRAAAALMEKLPAEALVFASSSAESLRPYAEKGIGTVVINYNQPETIPADLGGADTAIMISVPFVGPKRRVAHKNAVDAMVKGGIRRIVYTSICGAGDPTIDTYEVNDHVWTEAYIRESGMKWLFLRNSQYIEAMVSSYLEADENTGGVLSNNMGEGRMAFISRDDCAVAAACAALSDLEDQVLNINGAELLNMTEFCAIANRATGKSVTYRAVSDEENYAFFDSIGVPRTTEEMWADSAKNFPYCSDGMISFGRALRQGQMSTFTDDFQKLVGRSPITVFEAFSDIRNHLVGQRVSTDQ